VLDALREAAGEARSGEILSRSLGVTRAQVWKHIEALRGLGYQITGEPGGGYRLDACPDRLYPEELLPGLDTRWLGRELHWLETTDSTNRVAAELGQQGVVAGTAVIAEGQSAGRGRLGRTFYSPPHRNLYTSIVLRPTLDTAKAPTTILAAAAGVAEAIEATLGSRDGIEIKWPNDVLLGGRKTCGILMELFAEATRVGFLVLGIGVNLNVDPAEFPDEFRDRATSLAAFAGRRIDRVAFTRRLYGTLESVLDLHAERGFEALRPRFEAFFRMTGRRVAVADLDGSHTDGVARGIDADGALLLETDAGRMTRVVAGDVTLSRTPVRGVGTEPA
jgi:BirA family biotin operon repressor/biotin-[acetyl-CoA-carboxylase] ligase